jgi:hypothetical protein
VAFTVLRFFTVSFTVCCWAAAKKYPLNNGWLFFTANVYIFAKAYIARNKAMEPVVVKHTTANHVTGDGECDWLHKREQPSPKSANQHRESRTVAQDCDKRLTWTKLPFVISVRQK